MTVYLAGSELGIISASSVAIGTTASGLESGVTRAVLEGFTGASAWSRIDIPGSPLAEGWAHVRLTTRATSVGASAGSVVALRDNTGAEIVSLYQPAAVSGGILCYGGTYTEAFTVAGVYLIDFHWKIAESGGFIRGYINGSLVSEVTGDTRPAGGSSTGAVDLYVTPKSTASSSNNLRGFQQVLVSDESTIGAKVYTLALSAFGSTNEWTGVVADISAAASNDSTLIFTASVEQTTLMTKGTMPSITAGHTVTALCLAYRSMAEVDSVPQRIVPLARSGGTTYEQSVQTVSAAFVNRQEVMHVDPATGVDWTVAGINAAELGFRSRAAA